jgi:hypothetical protein
MFDSLEERGGFGVCLRSEGGTFTKGIKGFRQTVGNAILMES